MKNLLTTNGRISRTTFWKYWGVFLALGAAFTVLTETGLMTETLKLIVGLPMTGYLLISIFVQIKRWHDLDRSGWWILVNLIPIFGPILTFVICGFFPGTPGPNRFGPNPRGVKVAPPPPLPPTVPPPLPQLSPGLAAVVEHLRTLDPKSMRAVASRSGRPSEADIGAFEQAIGFRLPGEFREFLMSDMGCFYLESVESQWPRPQPGAIVPGWHLKYAIHVFGISSDAPESMDIRKRFAAFPQKGAERLVPFFMFPCTDDCYCFTKEGRIVHWDSLTGESDPVELTFSAFLLKEIRTLQERVQRIKNEPNPYAGS